MGVIRRTVKPIFVVIVVSLFSIASTFGDDIDNDSIIIADAMVDTEGEPVELKSDVFELRDTTYDLDEFVTTTGYASFAQPEVPQANYITPDSNLISFSNAPRAKPDRRWSVEIQWLYLQPRTTFGEYNFFYNRVSGPGTSVRREFTFENDYGFRVILQRPLAAGQGTYSLRATSFLAETHDHVPEQPPFFLGQNIAFSQRFLDASVDLEQEFLYNDLEATWDRQVDWSDATTIDVNVGVRGSWIEQQRSATVHSPTTIGSLRQHSQNSRFLGIGPALRAKFQKQLGRNIALFASPSVSLLVGKHKYKEDVYQARDVQFLRSNKTQLVPVLEFNGGISKSWDARANRITLSGGYQLISFQGLKASTFDQNTLATDTSLMGVFVGLSVAK